MRASYCKHCGQRLGDQDVFCIRCGQLAPNEEFESDAHVRETTTSVGVYERAQRLTQHAEESSNPEVQTDFAKADPTRYSSANPASRSLPPRRGAFPVLETLVGVLLLLGAAASMWIFHATLPKRQAQPPAVVVTIDPPSARVQAGRSAEFAATVSGTSNDEVTWSIREGSAGGQVVPKAAKAEHGRVFSLATYTAPKKAGTYHLLATSNTSPPSAVSAEITVVRK